jgi:RNA polymerase sigma factor (TIGR02999 family)
MSDAPTNITQLLVSWSSGRDKNALDQITPLVYRELRKLADSYLRRERGDHTLQPTALIHEAYMRMVDQSLPEWRSRAHFFGGAAQLMRQILCDHARRNRRPSAAAAIAKSCCSMRCTTAMSGPRRWSRWTTR